MDCDYDEIHKETMEIVRNLEKSEYVRVYTEDGNTDIVVQVHPKHIHCSSGKICDYKKGEKKGNLPGAEAYFSPMWDGKQGDSHGYFTVPIGFGGEKPVKYNVKFHVANGIIYDVQGFEKEEGDSDEAQQWVEDNIWPILEQEEGADVLAEVGFGMNKAITKEMAKKNWLVLYAEKIYESIHFANGGNKLNKIDPHVDWVVPDAKVEFDYKPA